MRTLRLKITTLIGDRIYAPGELATLADDRRAANLVAAGRAEYVTAVAAPLEAATAPPPPARPAVPTATATAPPPPAAEKATNPRK